MSVVEVAGSNTSTPNLPAPAYAAANARFLITDWVRVAGARLSETGVLFARAAWIVRDQQLAYDVSVLEHQIWRLENPHKRAEVNLNEVGQGLLVYATALEPAVDKTQLQLENLRGGFD